jgi:UrcA family protein
MKRNVRGKLSKSTRQMAIAIVASAVAASTAVHANPSNNIVLVPPTDLPVARQSGDAMLLHETIVGRSYADLPILHVSLSYGVNIADLDLATQDGPMALEKRVKGAAKAACEELGRKYPLLTLTPSNEDCAKAAADKAMVKARDLVAKARQKLSRGE